MISKKSSIVSGIFLIVLIAAKIAFYLIYGVVDFISLFTSGYNSLHM